MSQIRKKEALDYHSSGRKGKLEIIPTKPHSSQRDLALAYSPGVAEPVLAIAENPDDVYKYTAIGNLVAIISIGTAILGLGNPVTALSGISYQFATPPAQAELLIFNATGTLVESRAISSSHGVALIDANQFANGIYTCKLNENGRTVGIQRMVVSK